MPHMARKSATAEEPAETERSSVDAPGETADRSTETDAADAFRSLQPGETISVHRLSPSYAQGYLDHIVVPHGEELDVMSEIKANWGGGRYQLKAKRRAANGKMVFSGVNATVTVAGDPTLDGRVYRNGRLVDPEPQHSPHQAPQVVYAPQQQPTTNPMDPVNARILGFVETALANGGQAAGGGNTDIVGLIGALRETLQPARAPAHDPFKQIEQVMGLMGVMQERFGGGGSSGGEAEGGGLTGLGSNVENLLLSKIMGGNAPPQPPPWQQPTGQWMQGQWGGPPPGMPAPAGGPPPMGSMSGPPNWPNPPGPVQQYGPPGAGPPPGWAPPGQPPTPTPPPTQPTQQAATDDQDDDDTDDEGPFTVDNLMGEMESMGTTEREAFVAELAQRFGIDEQLGKQIFPDGAPQVTPNAVGQFPTGVVLPSE